MRKKYGTVYSTKVGSFKLVVAEDADSVREVLVKRSADYARRPPFHRYHITSFSMFCEQPEKYKALVLKGKGEIAGQRFRVRFFEKIHDWILKSKTDFAFLT